MGELRAVCNNQLVVQSIDSAAIHSIGLGRCDIMCMCSLCNEDYVILVY